MNIGLIDVDGHNFPNLALMRLSAYHKSHGDSVEMWDGFKHYDRVYMSKVFTFSPDMEPASMLMRSLPEAQATRITALCRTRWRECDLTTRCIQRGNRPSDF